MIRRGLLVVLIAMLAPYAAKAQETPSGSAFPKPSTATKVILLGTGNPYPDPNKSGPAVAVVAGGRAYLVDVGAGVVRRATKAAMRLGIVELRPEYLNVAFVTHLHSDHTLGLADLILTPWVIGRRRPLELYGPPGIEAMANHLLKAYDQDIQMRLGGLEAKTVAGFRVQVHEIEPGVVFRDGDVTVSAFAVNHGTWKHAFGYRFDTADRSIVISGDTAPSESLVEQAKGCDVLVHEVYSSDILDTWPADRQSYHKTFHTSGVELGRLASRIQPKLLVLYHQLSFSPKESIMREVTRNYDGDVAYGEDLDVY